MANSEEEEPIAIMFGADGDALRRGGQGVVEGDEDGEGEDEGAVQEEGPCGRIGASQLSPLSSTTRPLPLSPPSLRCCPPSFFWRLRPSPCLCPHSFYSLVRAFSVQNRRIVLVLLPPRRLPSAQPSLILLCPSAATP